MTRFAFLMILILVWGFSVPGELVSQSVPKSDGKAMGQSVDAVPIVISDIANFWKAYDASELGHREEAFQKVYLDAGSPGLEDFVKLRIQSAKALAAAVDQQYPKFYATVRPYTLEVEKQRAAILKDIARYKELYPEARFPPVYFVIGRLNSGGTVSERGLLIGLEVNSLGPGVDTSEIMPSYRKAMGTAEHIAPMVIHELTHTQQSSAVKLPPLLSHCLREGAADFMSELVTGGHLLTADRRAWGDQHRDELFQSFARDLAAKPGDASGWLYNYNQVKDEPADLGYWIGDEICWDYYMRATDKRKAIREIATLADEEMIVKNSKYAFLLRQ